MKTAACSLLLALLIATPLFAHGVIVVNAATGQYLPLLSSAVSVTVRNQVAITMTRMSFRNTTDSSLRPTFAFPLPSSASATQISYIIHDTLYLAPIAPTPQDSSLPGGDLTTDLGRYLGESPLYLHIQREVAADSVIIVELTYVELLPYDIGQVRYSYPADYSAISTAPVASLRFDLVLHSSRTITMVQMTSHPAALVSNSGAIATIAYAQKSTPSVADYTVSYALDLTQLGLFGFSTFLSDSASIADTVDGGYFTFVVEPNPSGTTDILGKIFTFVIDRSGSMYGDKIVQARNAASFIVNNLNEGDLFNLIDFDDVITSFRPAPVPYTVDNRDAALAYISTLTARGMTNIAGALSTAIRQFAIATDTTANIIVFLTDGLPTAGITNTEGILHAIDTSRASTENRVSIFAFGIGTDVNVSLLTQVAQRNEGLADFLQSDALESRITAFYTKIRNPVLLESHVAFSGTVVSEVYPDPLPNLFKGQQLVVSGRYSQAVPTTVTFSGKAFGAPVEYQYDLPLSDSAAREYQFLPKLWAKGKIEHLMILYRAAYPGSPVADSLRAEVVRLSLRYGVLTEFTSFSGNTDPPIDLSDVESPVDIAGVPVSLEIIGVYPNPFNPSTAIRVQIRDQRADVVILYVYNLLGQLVRRIELTIAGPGEYVLVWDGLTNTNANAPSGTYVIAVECNGVMKIGKVVLLR